MNLNNAVLKDVTTTAVHIVDEFTQPMDIEELIHSSMEKAMGITGSVNPEQSMNCDTTAPQEPPCHEPSQHVVTDMEEARLARLRQMAERGDDEDEEVRRLVDGPPKLTGLPTWTRGNGIPVKNLRPGFESDCVLRNPDIGTSDMDMPNLPKKPTSNTPKLRRRSARLQAELRALSKEAREHFIAEKKRKNTYESNEPSKIPRGANDVVQNGVVTTIESQAATVQENADANALAPAWMASNMVGSEGRPNNHIPRVGFSRTPTNCFNGGCNETYLRLKVLEADLRAMEAEKKAMVAERAEFEARVRANDAQNIICALEHRVRDAEARQQRAEAELQHRMVVLEEFYARRASSQTNFLIRGSSARSYSDPY